MYLEPASKQLAASVLDESHFSPFSFAHPANMAVAL